MFYNIHNGYQRTPFHIKNATEVYENCKSRELITSSIKVVCVLVIILRKLSLA